MCFRFRAPCGLPAASCASGQTHVRLHLAAGAAQQRVAVRQGAGLHHLDDERRPRAAETPPESSTHGGPEGEGEASLLTEFFRRC